MNTGELLVVLAAVVTGGLVKSITGMGLPIIAIPVISLFVDPATAIAVLALPNTLQNLTIAVRHREHRGSTRHLGWFCAAGMCGAAAGTLTIGVIPERVTLAVLLIAVVAYLAQAITHPDLHVPDRLVGRLTPAAGALAGAFQGAVGISGPVVGSWHHGLHLPREAFVLSVTTVFLLTGGTQLLVLTARGDIADVWGPSLLVAAVVLATVPVGAQLRDRLSGPRFQSVVLGLIAASCIGILVEVIGI